MSKEEIYVVEFEKYVKTNDSDMRNVVLNAMQTYSDQQTTKLRELLKECRKVIGNVHGGYTKLMQRIDEIMS